MENLKQSRPLKSKAKKGTRKSFYEVKTPFTATKIKLFAADKVDLVGKVVLLDLTRSLRGKSLQLGVKIILSEDELIGVPFKANLSTGYLRKIVRKGTDYVEDSFGSECRDCIVRIKPFFITRKRVSRTVRRAIRDLAKKTLVSHLKTRNADEIFSEIMSNKLQKSLALKLKKIYPLAASEIKGFEILRPLDKKKEKKVEEKQESN